MGKSDNTRFGWQAQLDGFAFSLPLWLLFPSSTCAILAHPLTKQPLRESAPERELSILTCFVCCLVTVKAFGHDDIWSKLLLYHVLIVLTFQNGSLGCGGLKGRNSGSP
jgi:hypothetical protein